MYIARLICSDPECGTAMVAEAGDVMELVTLVCGCGCGLDIRGLPDWVDDGPADAGPAPIPFPQRLLAPDDLAA